MTNGQTPTWDEFLVPVLNVFKADESIPVRDLRQTVIAQMGLSGSQLAEQIGSGQSRVANRIGWAVSHLFHARALERPTRAQYRITDIGRQLREQYPNRIPVDVLESKADPEDVFWTGRPKPVAGITEIEAEKLDPMEQIELGVSRIHDEVSSELLQRLLGKDPAFFEQAVVDLIVAMGYGGADTNAVRTQLSNDGGIDGIIDQDVLGLSSVYVQAKRYALDHAVGRPDIQGFVGAIHGQRSSQGVFITTGRFSPAARSYAASIQDRVVLIDGIRLAALMLRYGVGVQVRRTVEIVEIDEDFFE